MTVSSRRRVSYSELHYLVMFASHCLSMCVQGPLEALPSGAVVGVAEFAFEGMPPRCMVCGDSAVTRTGMVALGQYVRQYAQVPERKKQQPPKRGLFARWL